MEHFMEAVLVSTEAIVLVISIRGFLNSKYSLSQLEEAPHLNVGNSLVTALGDSDGSISYASLRGHVEALSPPLRSFHVPDVTGVIQKVTVREHTVSQTRSGFWLDNKRIINSMMNSVPFAIRSATDDVKVEVVDAISAKVLDLEVVADRYDVTTSSFFDTLWQFFTGMRKQGVQTVEEVLKEGTLVTVVGEVVGRPGAISVLPPRNGGPFFITTMPLSALVRKVESDINFHKWMSIGLGILTTATCSWLIYKHFKDWFRKEAEKRRLQGTRKARRRLVRTGEELSPDKLCVVCQENPKEIILLPCGHVCLCEDCSDKISSSCPICKETIQSRNAAYIA